MSNTTQYLVRIAVPLRDDHRMAALTSISLRYLLLLLFFMNVKNIFQLGLSRYISISQARFDLVKTSLQVMLYRTTCFPRI